MKNVFSGNVALFGCPGQTFSQFSIEKLSSFFKGEVGGLLSVQEVREGKYYSKKKGGVTVLADYDSSGNVFSFIDQKEEIIQKNIENIAKQLSTSGKFDDIIFKELLHTYLAKGSLAVIDIRDWIEIYFEQNAKIMFLKLHLPTFGELKHITDRPKKILDSHHLERDFREDEKRIFAYMMANGYFNLDELLIIEKSLAKAGMDFIAFYKQYLDENFVETYIMNHIL